MGKKVAVIAVNPVNGSGLFQYLEAFFENGIAYRVFAVADTNHISTNSGIAFCVDDVIANLKGHEAEYDALVFACGDAIPVFSEHVSKAYNQDMLAVIAAFGQQGKIVIGHCAAALIFELAGVIEGKTVAVHPLAKPAIQKGNATDEACEVDGNLFTAQSENTIGVMIDQVVAALK